MGEQKPHLLIKTRQQPRRRERGRVRALHQVLSAGQTRRQTLDHPAAVPGALRRESHASRPVAQRRFSTHLLPTTTATSTGSSASSAASGGSSRSTSRTMALSPHGNTASPYITDDQTLYSRRSRPSPGTTPAPSSTGSASSPSSSTSISPIGSRRRNPAEQRAGRLPGERLPEPDWPAET